MPDITKKMKNWSKGCCAADNGKRERVAVKSWMQSGNVRFIRLLVTIEPLRFLIDASNVTLFFMDKTWRAYATAN